MGISELRRKESTRCSLRAPPSSRAEALPWVLHISIIGVQNLSVFFLLSPVQRMGC